MSFSASSTAGMFDDPAYAEKVAADEQEVGQAGHQDAGGEAAVHRLALLEDAIDRLVHRPAFSGGRSYGMLLVTADVLLIFFDSNRSRSSMFMKSVLPPKFS